MTNMPDILNWNTLNETQREDWDRVYQPWLNESFFRGCMKNNGFKMDCIDCADVFVIVEIAIDARGKITDWKEIENGIDCPGKTSQQINLLKDCMKESFSTLIFPESLRNIRYRTLVGEESMC